MKPLSWCLASVNAALFVLCLAFPPLWPVGIGWGGYSEHDWHPFVTPHVVLSGSLAFAVVFALFSRTATTALSIVTTLHAILAATYEWAMLQWPGGDDGGGMAWQLFIGVLTAVSVSIAAVVAWKPLRSRGDHRSITNMERGGAALVTGVAAAFALRVLGPWLDLFVHL